MQDVNHWNPDDIAFVTNNTIPASFWLPLGGGTIGRLGWNITHSNQEEMHARRDFFARIRSLTSFLYVAFDDIDFQ